MDALSLAAAARDPEVAPLPALIAAGVTHTFADLAALAARLRTAVIAEGVTPGARIALIARNAVETVVAVHAIADLGATLVPIHPRLTPTEVDVLLVDASPTLVLRHDDLVSLCPIPIPIPIPLPHPYPNPDALRPIPIPYPYPNPDALRPIPTSSPPLAMVYTSGTTGRPKGSVLPRRAFLSSAAASAQNLGWTPIDRWLCAMPLCHVGGLSILTRCLAARRPVILEPRFDPDAVLASVTRHDATLLSVVPTMLEALLERDTANVLSRLRAVLLGGAAAPWSLLEECARRDIPALTTYGLTEACSQVTAQPPTHPYRPNPGSGIPLPGIDLRIDPASHILVRGPTLMSGYFRGDSHPLDPAVSPEGWLDTGDLGELDERGHLFVHARRTDLIVTGGENVYPVEVEERLASLPGVRRALVFGVPDARWGQIVAAAIELAPGASLDDLAPLAAALLAPHKRPRLACAVAALPLTGSGKLDRARAFERHAAALVPFPRGAA